MKLMGLQIAFRILNPKESHNMTGKLRELNKTVVHKVQYCGNNL
jgi:hypothetical protein